MLVIKRKEGEPIDKMLKRYKRKYRDAHIMQEVKDNMYFTKPSDERREVLNKAEYTNQLELAGEI